MAESEFKNVSVQADRVVVSQPFDLLGGVIATALYVLILYALFEKGFPLRQIRTGFIIAFAITTAIWLWYMAGRRMTTVFDAAEGKVFRRNLFRTEKVLDFTALDGIVEVSHGAGYSGGSYFKIAPKANRFGKGYRLTRTYKGADTEFLYMRTVAIPAIEAMAGLEGRAVEAAAEVDLDSPGFYTKAGGHYVRRFWRRPLVFLCFGLALAAFGWSGANNWAIGTGLGIALVMLLLPVSKLVLDTDDKVISTYHMLGLRQKQRIPFADYLAVESTRTRINGIYTGTTLEMRFAGDHKNLPLATVYFTGSLGGLAAETEAILQGGGSDDDS